MVASREVELPITKEWEENEDGGLALSLKLLGELLFLSWKNMLSQLLDASVLIC